MPSEMACKPATWVNERRAPDTWPMQARTPQKWPDLGAQPKYAPTGAVFMPSPEAERPSETERLARKRDAIMAAPLWFLSSRSRRSLTAIEKRLDEIGMLEYEKTDIYADIKSNLKERTVVLRSALAACIADIDALAADD